MLSRRNVFTVTLAALVGIAAPALAATSFDTDNDGTVDLNEAKKAASALVPIVRRSAKTGSCAQSRSPSNNESGSYCQCEKINEF